MLNYSEIRKAPVCKEPYPFFVAPMAFANDEGAKAAADFPRVDRPGSIDVEETGYGPAFAKLLDELRSDEFRRLIAEKFDVRLDDKDVVIHVRGKMRVTDGNIHTDTPSKLVTVLLYFNEPGTVDETALRILKNGRDLDDYVAEIPPHLGTLMAFKVTPDCWHGHKALECDRRSLQMNYLSGIKTVGKHQLGHRLVGRMKRKVAALFS